MKSHIDDFPAISIVIISSALSSSSLAIICSSKRPLGACFSGLVSMFASMELLNIPWFLQKVFVGLLGSPLPMYGSSATLYKSMQVLFYLQDYGLVGLAL
jgi:hypothetical protein